MQFSIMAIKFLSKTLPKMKEGDLPFAALFQPSFAMPIVSNSFFYVARLIFPVDISISAAVDHRHSILL